MTQEAAQKAPRKTRYGLPIPVEKKEDDVSKHKPYKTYTALPKFYPVSDEVTPYGAKKFRTPTSAKQFKGFQGSAQEAYVLDIDGTMQTFGSGCDADLLKWCAAQYKRNPDTVFLIVTARDHEWMMETSFNWVMHHFPYAFVGPFCRAKDDPRYASEFKRELCQGFEDMGLYRIVGAADDNLQVIDMWKQWAIDHFEEPKDFQLLECDYGYADWRYDLPSKGTSTTTYAGNYGRKWINGWLDAKTGEWIKGHYEDEPEVRIAKGDPLFPSYLNTGAKNRPAGTSSHPPMPGVATPKVGEIKDIALDPSWERYFEARYGSKTNKPGQWPTAGLGVISESPNLPVEQSADERLDEVIDLIGDETSIDRSTLEDIVGHEYPGYSPGEIAEMSMSELRELAGITGDEYREMLYEEIGNIFGSRCCDRELDDLDIDEVEDMLDMTKSEIESYLDAADRQRAKDFAATNTGDTPEIEARHYERIDLEDDVKASYPEVPMRDIVEMDSIVLRQMLKDALEEEQAHGPKTEPLEVKEVLNALALDGPTELVFGIEVPVVDVELPPVADEAQQQVAS